MNRYEVHTNDYGVFTVDADRYSHGAGFLSFYVDEGGKVGLIVAEFSQQCTVVVLSKGELVSDEAVAVKA